MMHKHWQRLGRCGWILAFVVFLARTQAATAQSQVDLPFTPPQADPLGNSWQLNGEFTQQGNNPEYIDGAEVCINDQRAQFPGHQGTMDANGEIVFGDYVGKNFVLTRRMLLSKDGSMLRVLDSVHNTGVAGLHLWYCSHSTTPLAHVQFKQSTGGLDLTCVARDQRGIFVIECFGTEGSGLLPKFDAAEGNNGIVANFYTSIAPDATMTFVHFHGVSSVEPAAGTLDPAALMAMLADVPADLRRTIVNFPVAGALRSDLPAVGNSDLVELISGERVRGTIVTPKYEIRGVYGAVSIPAERVVGFSDSSGASHRQTLTLRDGSVLSGQLTLSDVEIDRGDSKPAHIPLAEITRLTYRPPASQPTTEPAATAWIVTTAGDHLSIRPPATPIPLRTLYGKIDVPAAMVAEVQFGAKLSAHELQFTDGSHLCGLIGVDALDVQLADTTFTSSLQVPIGSITLVHLGSAPRRLAPESAPLRLNGEDCLAATLAGEIHLQTQFDEITIPGADVRAIRRPADAGSEVAITRGDGSTVQGLLRETTLKFQTKPGLAVELPAAMIVQYAPPGK